MFIPLADSGSVTYEDLQKGIAFALSASALFGLILRVLLVPYLKNEIVKPVKETHRQVTVNGGKSNPPTLKDEIAEIKKIADEANSNAIQANSNAKLANSNAKQANMAIETLGVMFDGHLTWSQDEVDTLTSRIKRLEDEQDLGED